MYLAAKPHFVRITYGRQWSCQLWVTGARALSTSNDNFFSSHLSGTKFTTDDDDDEIAYFTVR